MCSLIIPRSDDEGQWQNYSREIERIYWLESPNSQSIGQYFNAIL